ncbi:508_t:CDS:2 [Funneliformis caledonium]|uniref:Nucleotide exchange factor SIL1 n=1 Tax=Funneliformis caledonium TaxID=1117310 RepID=A0A9N8ZUV7_9GLOM|nr:508_t:CDS:2 [Funneliformis caledonium]
MRKALYFKFFCALSIFFLTIFVLPLEAKEEICNGDECYSKEFVATEEFQEVREGQEIHPGLHVKIDMSTGKKYAKILDPNDNETNKSSEVIIIDEHGNPINQEENASENLLITDKSQTNNKDSDLKFHQDSNESIFSHPFITSKHKENVRIPHSDHVQFESYLSQLENSSSIQVINSALDGLEELVHELDFGIKLARSQGIKIILALLDHDSAQIKKKAAIVIGTAMQNNPTAQNDVSHLNIVTRIFESLSIESDIKVSIRLLYALSSIVRGNKNAIQFIKDSNGLQSLVNLYQSSSNNEFRAKCALFISDFIDPNMIGQNTGLFEQGQYYDSIDPLMNVMEIWCRKFQETLFDNTGSSNKVDIDSREKILKGISMIKSQYSSSCETQDGFKNWIVKEEIEAIGEDYLEDYYKLIIQVKAQFGF